MISTDGFVALRTAATIAHSLPAVRLRIHHGDELLVDVATEGSPRPPEARHAVTPCGFRNSVVRAWAEVRAGGRLRFMDLPLDTDPSIEIGLPPCGRLFPGGIHRVATEDRDVYAFATTLAGDAAQDEITTCSRDLTPPPGVRGIGLRRDAGTDVGLVYVEVDRERRSVAEPAVVGLLEDLLAKVVVRGLLDELAAPSSR